MTGITSKGYNITTGYTSVLPADGTRNCVAFHNLTTGILFITIGGSTTDADAMQLAANEYWEPRFGVAGEVKMKAAVAGVCTVIGCNLP